MLKRIRKFYEDHQEAIVIGLIATGVSVLSTAIIMARDTYQHQIADISVFTPNDYESGITSLDQPVKLILTLNDGTKQYRDMRVNAIAENIPAADI